jgi:hypothetical protein
MLVLEWFQPPPKLNLEWFGPNSKTSAAAGYSRIASVAAIIGPSGRKGDAGPAGIGLNGSGIAAEPIGGHRAVYAAPDGLRYASNDSDLSIDVLGVSRFASAFGEECGFQPSGEMTDPSFSFLPGPIYLGTQGELTQDMPTSGWVVEIGIGITPTKILIRVQPPIFII